MAGTSPALSVFYC